MSHAATTLRYEEPLKAIIESSRAESDPRELMAEDKYFDYFAVTQLLREFSLPGDALVAGITDGERDCGVDAIYTFLEGNLLENGRPSTKASPPRFEIVIVQCKRSARFEEDALLKLAYHLPKLFFLDRDLQELAGFANARLIERTGVFLDAYRGLASRRPEVNITVYYVSMGGQVHPNLAARARAVEVEISNTIRNCSTSVQFIGASELLDRTRQKPTAEASLSATIGPIFSESEMGYVCLVSFADYFNFLIDENRELNHDLFDANVRDHEGATEVNEHIRATLDEKPLEEFWWLNNGVTVVASDVVAMNKRLHLTDAQVVNGLQTSTELFHHLSRQPDVATDDRLLLVRVVKAVDAATRNRIVRATNSQNKLPESALRATDRIQQNIEDQLKARGFHYERRSNYYRNRGYPVDKLVTMDRLAKCVTSVLLQQPDLARGGSPRLFSDLYSQVFSVNYPQNVYYNALLLVRRAEHAMSLHPDIKNALIEDWSYHIACVAAILHFRKRRPSYDDLAGLNISEIPVERLHDLVPIVALEYNLANSTTQYRPHYQLACDSSVAKRIVDRAASFTSSRNWRVWPSEPVDAEYAIKAGEKLRVSARVS